MKGKKMMKQIFLLTMLCCAALITQALAQSKLIPAKGYAKLSKEGKFEPYKFERHAVGDSDILIETMYAGVCHSDIHHAKGEWKNEQYPMVPGHEIAGRVTQVGKNVTKFKVGDYAGVGCMVNSCGQCEFCKKGEEQYCLKVPVLTYASKDYFHGNEITKGGYSNNMVVTENFAIKIPQNAQMDKVAPLLCAGITTYAPIEFTHVKKGDTIAVAGFGGLGHMAVQYAVAKGAKVTVFDITEDKRADALQMGAVKYVNVKDSTQLKDLNNKYTVIISTIPAKYDPTMYLKMLKMDGDLVIVGLPANENSPSVNINALVYAGRRKIYGSQIGGIRQTQEMLDFSVKSNIYPSVEIIPIQQLDEAYEQVLAGQVKFRYVIDMKTLK
jgi:uncharacterized zinc-type alcohol dehydrogenase-like protein